jgi:hypothetical protein
MFGMLKDRAVFCEISPFVPSCITNTSTIPQLFGGRAPQSDSDDIVLAPLSINPRSAPSLQPEEFRLQGKFYVHTVPGQIPTFSWGDHENAAVALK